MEQLIRKQEGEPFVAPSMREIPLAENSEAFAFAEKLFAGGFAMVILLTGGGTPPRVWRLPCGAVHHRDPNRAPRAGGARTRNRGRRAPEFALVPGVFHRTHHHRSARGVRHSSHDGAFPPEDGFSGKRGGAARQAVDCTCGEKTVAGDGRRIHVACVPAARFGSARLWPRIPPG